MNLIKRGLRLMGMMTGSDDDDNNSYDNQISSIEKDRLHQRMSYAERLISKFEQKIYRLKSDINETKDDIGKKIDDWQSDLKSSADFDCQIMFLQQAFIKLKKEKDEMLADFQEMKIKNRVLILQHKHIKDLIKEIQNEEPWVCSKCKIEWNQSLGEISDEEWEDDDN